MTNDMLLVYSDLACIKHFLDYVIGGVDREFAEIEKRRISGEIETLEDLECAYDNPIARLSIAVKAAMYETNALVERHLYRVAWAPWIKIAGRKPKSLLDIKNLSLYSLRQLEMVNDLPFAKALELIESHYSIRLTEFPGWELLTSIREEVNAHKHRGGFVDFRKVPPEDIKGIPEPYPIDRQKAYDGLKAAHDFLGALSKLPGRTV
jgi:hypothetical protein